jgi:hypothetical protein
MLNDRFVLGTCNIAREQHVGLSHGYRCNQTAVDTTNGAGGRNVQIVVLAPDETVLHVLPGFWHADDLLAELRLALEMHELHRRDGMSEESKLAMYRALHRSFVRRLPDETKARSEWQGFDRFEELERAQSEARDTVVCDANGQPVGIKPIYQVVHERLAARPLLHFDDFDMESFVDYGRPYYDNNMGIDKGREFASAERMNRKRERAQEKARKAAER